MSVPDIVLMGRHQTLQTLASELQPHRYQVHQVDHLDAVLELVKTKDVHVLVCHQNEPGVDSRQILHRMSQEHPWITRIMVGDQKDRRQLSVSAVNEAHVYTVLFYPWEEVQLRTAFFEAVTLHRLNMRHQELASELKSANRALMKHIDSKNRALYVNTRSALMTQAILDKLPVGVLHIGEDGRILEANQCARQWLMNGNAIAGLKARQLLPEGLLDMPLGEGVLCVVGETRCLALRDEMASDQHTFPTQIITLIPQSIY